MSSSRAIESGNGNSNSYTILLIFFLLPAHNQVEEEWVEPITSPTNTVFPEAIPSQIAPPTTDSPLSPVVM